MMGLMSLTTTMRFDTNSLYIYKDTVWDIKFYNNLHMNRLHTHIFFSYPPYPESNFTRMKMNIEQNQSNTQHDELKLFKFPIFSIFFFSSIAGRQESNEW